MFSYVTNLMYWGFQGDIGIEYFFLAELGSDRLQNSGMMVGGRNEIIDQK